MPNRKIIVPNDNRLSFEATAVLTAMLNLPEGDYHTPEELCTFFESDSLKTIKAALTELAEAKYLICVNKKTYAVNKLRIPQMKIV